MGAEIGMLIVETIAKIRRLFFVQGKPIKAICRELRLSRKVVRKVVRSKATEFHYEREAQPLPKIGPWSDKLDQLLLANEAKVARERLTLIRLFEELCGLGYDGGYDAVRRYARRWAKGRGQSMAAAYVPLSFAPGEAYQFDCRFQVFNPLYAAALLSESLFRGLAKLFDYFNGVHPAGQLREDSGLIAKTGTDFENAVVGLDVEQIGHQGDEKSLRDRLFEADWKWNVGIRVGLIFDWHKLVPRHVAHGCHDAFVKGTLSDCVTQLKGAGGDDREHVFTQGLKVFCSHSNFHGHAIGKLALTDVTPALRMGEM